MRNSSKFFIEELNVLKKLVKKKLFIVKQQFLKLHSYNFDVDHKKAMLFSESNTLNQIKTTFF